MDSTTTDLVRREAVQQRRQRELATAGIPSGVSRWRLRKRRPMDGKASVVTGFVFVRVFSVVRGSDP